MKDTGSQVVVSDNGFSHTDQALMQNPFPLYAKLRAECPVSHTTAHGGFWTVATYADLKAVEFDYETYSNADGTGIPPSPISPMYPQDIDPPLQTEYRRLLNKHFNGVEVLKWRDKIIAETHDLIDGFIERGHADLASDLCRPMPPRIAWPLLGVPAEDEAQLRAWVEHLTVGRGTDPEAVALTAGKIGEYLRQHVARRRAEAPRDDVLGDLLTTEIGGGPLTERDIVGVLTILLLGALDTTTAAMLQALKHLAENPGDKQRLIDDPTLWPLAAQEFVRFASPVQGLARTLTKDATLHDAQLHKGDKLMLLFGSANRDERKFVEPDRCIIDRTPNAHLAFGIGPHVCAGRHMALLQLETLLRIVLERLPDYALANDRPIQFVSAETRGIASLPVRFTPGKRGHGS